MPYIVREGDPLPWFQGTSDALGSLIDVAMRDRQSNQAAARDEAAFGRQRQAAGEDYTRNRAAAKEDYTTRQADENTRDLRNFGQQRDLIGMRQQYETEQANRARTEDADAATTLAPMLNLPVEAPMAGGAAGPGPMANYGKMGTKGVLAIAQNQRALADDQRMSDQNAAMQAERMADNERQDAALQGTGDYQKQVLELRRKQMENAARGGAATAYKPSPVQVQNAQNAEKQSAYYAGLARSWQTNEKARDQMIAQGQTLENLVAQAQLWQMRASAALEQPEQDPSQQPVQSGAAYPPDVLTEEDRAEYDALRAEESGGF